MSLRITLAVAVLAAAVAGCGEKPQTASTTKKADGKGYELVGSNHVADGWKGGDKAAWEAQLRARAQGQNEYPRSLPRAAAPAAPAAVAPMAVVTAASAVTPAKTP